ncbi:Tetratricopeptide TPR_2 repeat protein [Desulfatibacillum aliphaticivorans]|uniref:Tetratricopeptide TPR_2 repeat protein n=1 Tax=Desulfatibacillum aliphaticivorans TaxID=218208 RepID=B8FD67_DESAL|nr:tetratricopeptide repeat protein [Desulfatibacillum aliphaticivorans]ACL06498.1 Tetratricopeptide TPR_2 repeat protein [Desulfatibacillum aliphaticivorans]
MPQEGKGTDSYDFDLKGPFDRFRPKPHAFAFISMFFILILVYSNTFHGVFVFDDNTRIVKNEYIRMERLDFESITDSFRDEQTGAFRLWRPLAFLTFALNYYAGGLEPTGFHAFNLSVHFLAAWFLFLFIRAMLNLPMLRDKYGELSYPLALLTSVFWAVHPIQVTSVTYVVQRMASMAGMFYIAAMFFYIKGRFAHGKIKWGWFAATGISGLCAIASKENAVLLAPSLAMFELILIQGASRQNLAKFAKWTFWICAVGALAAFFLANPFNALSYYSIRPFSMWERLATQPRVMMLYLGLLLYPTPGRMTFLYDVPYTASLLDPISGLWSFLSFLAALGIGLGLMRKSPLLSFCILFFFLNHAVESTFLPLEMVYEHRNYIPSMLLFLPAFLFVLKLIARISNEKSVKFLGICMIGFVIIAQGNMTIHRNGLFRSKEAFWSDNAFKSPNLGAPYISLGSAYYQRGRLNLAEACFQKALQLNRFQNTGSVETCLFNLGMINLYLHNQPKAALAFFQSAKIRAPGKVENDRQMAHCWMLLRRYELAMDRIDKSLNRFPDDPKLLHLKAISLFKMERYKESAEDAKKALNIAPAFIEPTLTLAAIEQEKGAFDSAVRLYKAFALQSPNRLDSILPLIELGVLTKNENLAQTQARLLYKLKGEASLQGIFSEFAKDQAVRAYAPDFEVLDPVLKK